MNIMDMPPQPGGSPPHDQPVSLESLVLPRRDLKVLPLEREDEVILRIHAGQGDDGDLVFRTGRPSFLHRGIEAVTEAYASFLKTGVRTDAVGTRYIVGRCDHRTDSWLWNGRGYELPWRLRTNWLGGLISGPLTGAGPYLRVRVLMAFLVDAAGKCHYRGAQVHGLRDRVFPSEKFQWVQVASIEEPQ